MAATKRRHSPASADRRHARWAAHGEAAADRTTDALTCPNGPSRIGKAARARARRRRISRLARASRRANRRSRSAA